MTIISSNSASIQPVLGIEIPVCSIAGGSYTDIDAYVTGAASNAALLFRLYATVGTVRSRVAEAQYAGGTSRLLWNSPPEISPIHAGGSIYDLVVFASAGGASPIKATLAGANFADVASNSNQSNQVPFPLVPFAEVSVVSGIGYAQFADISAVQAPLPECEFVLYASCGPGSVEAPIASIPIAGGGKTNTLLQNLSLSVATVYRLACKALDQPGNSGISVNASLSLYSTVLPQNSVIVIKTVALASSAGSKGQALIPVGNEVTLAVGSALSNNILYAGVAATDFVPGGQVQLITQGLVDPTIAKLSSGFASAVGTDIGGNIVRVNDTANVSGLKYLGSCDTNGNISASSTQNAQALLTDFGAIGNGITDDALAIQQGIAFCDKFSVPLFAAASIYAIGTELSIPPSSSGHVGFSFIGVGLALGPSGLGNDRTTFVALGALRSVLAVERAFCNISGFKFDGAKLTKYGIYFVNAVDSLLANCLAVNTVIDGYYFESSLIVPGCNNDTIELNNCFAQNNGTTYSTAGIIGTYNGRGAIVTAIAGTIATSAGSYILTVSGGPDLTTMGIRPGDIICVGGTQFYSIGEVHDSTHLYIGGNIFPSANVAGLDYAINIGHGLNVTKSADNNLANVHAGQYLFNAANGMQFSGIYGPQVSSTTIAQYNGAFGIGLGFGGGPGGPTVASILQAAIIRPYFEGNLGGSILNIGCQGCDIIQPQLQTVGVVADPLQTSGYWSDIHGMHAFGNDGEYQSNIYGSRLLDPVTTGSDTYEEGSFNITSATFQFPANVTIATYAMTGDQTLTSTPTIATGLSGQFLRLFNVSAHTLTLQRDSFLPGTKLKLVSDMLALPPYSSVLFMYSGAVAEWVQAQAVITPA